MSAGYRKECDEKTRRTSARVSSWQPLVRQGSRGKADPRANKHAFTKGENQGIFAERERESLKERAKASEQRETCTARISEDRGSRIRGREGGNGLTNLRRTPSRETSAAVPPDQRPSSSSSSVRTRGTWIHAYRLPHLIPAS